MICREYHPLCNSSTSVLPSNILQIIADAGYARNWTLLLGLSVSQALATCLSACEVL
jgi:hypothetical protein